MHCVFLFTNFQEKFRLEMKNYVQFSIKSLSRKDSSEHQIIIKFPFIPHFLILRDYSCEGNIRRNERFFGVKNVHFEECFQLFILQNIVPHGLREARSLKILY